MTARWDALDQLAAIKAEQSSSTAERYAWTAVTNSVIDARDFLADIEFGGVEAVTSAFWSHLAAHPSPFTEVHIAEAIGTWTTPPQILTKAAA